MFLVRRVVVFCAATGFIAFLPAVHAAQMPMVPIRALSVAADLVIVAAPLDPNPPRVPRQYKVLEVLKGAGIAPGDRIKLGDVGVYHYEVRFTEQSDLPPPIDKALLFLRYPAPDKPADEYGVALSGIRILNQRGQFLTPVQFSNPGGFSFVKRGELDWQGTIDTINRDLPEIAGVQAFERIADRAVRNQVIFRWLEAHKLEIARSHKDPWTSYMFPRESSWGPLDEQLFDWIMESCRADDCWRATVLADELHVGLSDRRPSFCNEPGRTLLMEKTFDERLPEPVRFLALKALGNGLNSWYVGGRFRDFGHFPGTVPIQQHEQSKLLKRLEPLLRHPERDWRIAAAKAIKNVSHSYDAQFFPWTHPGAVPKLIESFQIEADPWVRCELLEAVSTIESDYYSHHCNQNPASVGMLLRFLGPADDNLRFELILRSEAEVTELPTFYFRRRDQRWNIVAVEELEPVLVSPHDRLDPPWRNGSAVVTIPAASISEGVWEVTAVGYLAAEEKRWRSEMLRIKTTGIEPR